MDSGNVDMRGCCNEPLLFEVWFNASEYLEPGITSFGDEPVEFNEDGDEYIQTICQQCGTHFGMSDI